MRKIRIPKFKIRMNTEFPMPEIEFTIEESAKAKVAMRLLIGPLFRISSFGFVSDFGFRISDFVS
jgi:hypothetical protein